jgi:hypothetical protein
MYRKKLNKKIDRAVFRRTAAGSAHANNMLVGRGGVRLWHQKI